MDTLQSGEVFFALMSGVAISVLVTWIFSSLYTRAVARTMRKVSPDRDAARAVPAPAAPVAAAPIARVLYPRRRLATSYALACGLSVAILSWPPMREVWRDSHDGLGLLRALIWWYSNCAPAVIIVSAMVAATRRQTLLALGAVWLSGVTISIAVPMVLRVLGGRAFTADLLLNGVSFTEALALSASVPLALVLVTGRPRVRNVMPLMLALVIPLSLAFVLLMHWMLVNSQHIDTMNPFLGWLVVTLGARRGPALLFLALCVPVSWLGWKGVGSLSHRYRAKHFSNVQLIADSWWAVVVAFGVGDLWRYGQQTALASAAAAYLVFWIGSRLALRGLRRAPRQSGPSLLLLRVFGFQNRTEGLFDAVAERWRFEGPVALIAGADLALRSIDADDALAFARGRIESSYVGDADGLTRRLAALNAVADPDGRFRVEEFFCFDNTWRATLQSLVVRSHVVLMDLRGFTATNAGCLYELQQLAAEGRTSTCVFVVDDSTDRALAAATLGAAAATTTAPAWVEIGRNHASATVELWERLIAAGYGRGPSESQD